MHYYIFVLDSWFRHQIIHSRTEAQHRATQQFDKLKKIQKGNCTE